MNLTDINHWNEPYHSGALVVNDDAIDYKLLSGIADRFIFNSPTNSNLKSVIEIGCCPGRFLAYFGSKGLTLNGIDFIENVNNLKDQLVKSGFNANQFWLHDFEQFSTINKFSIVCSFGFIEHFINYNTMLVKHAELVEEGGFLFVSTPNFRTGFQYLFHTFTDMPNRKKHYLPSMNINKWESLLVPMGFKICYKGYVGDYYWDENGNKFRIQFWIQTLIRKVSKLYVKIFGINRVVGSHCVIVAQKLK